MEKLKLNWTSEHRSYAFMRDYVCGIKETCSHHWATLPKKPKSVCVCQSVHLYVFVLCMFDEVF